MTVIKIRQQTQRIVVDPTNRGVSVVNGGPIGPPGAAGPPGQSGEGLAFDFVQVVPSVSWVINHDLGVEPLWNAFEAGTGDILEPAERHHTVNQLELMFLTPRAGKARLRS